MTNPKKAGSKDIEEKLASRVPYHTLESLKLYISDGIPPGGFLTAVLENDLMGAFGRADSQNAAALFDICAYIHNCVPYRAHGSPERVRAWITEHAPTGAKGKSA